MQESRVAVDLTRSGRWPPPNEEQQKPQSRCSDDSPLTRTKDHRCIDHHECENKLHNPVTQPRLVLIVLNHPPADDIGNPNRGKGIVEEQPSTPIEADFFAADVCGMVPGRLMAPTVVIMKGAHDMGQVDGQTYRPGPSRNGIGPLPIPSSQVDDNSREIAGDGHTCRPQREFLSGHNVGENSTSACAALEAEQSVINNWGSLDFGRPDSAQENVIDRGKES